MAANPDNVFDFPTTPKLATALIAARKEIKNPMFDSRNPHFNSKFASLKEVIAAVEDALLENGIVFQQDPQGAENGINCRTILTHESGEEKVFGPLFFPCTKDSAQGYASAVTYARRYQLMSVMGLVGVDEDDDGNAASEMAFTSKQMKTKYYKGLKAAAAEDDAGKARELWDELNNEQRLEVWNDLRDSSGVRSAIKSLLSSTGEDSAKDL